MVSRCGLAFYRSILHCAQRFPFHSYRVLEEFRTWWYTWATVPTDGLSAEEAARAFSDKAGALTYSPRTGLYLQNENDNSIS